MNKWNNYETLEHYRGRIWISKLFKRENRGNICVQQNDDFIVISYISPDMLEKEELDSVIYNTLKANGTLRMLEDDTLITCSDCGNSYDEEHVNIVDYEDDLCVDCENKRKRRSLIISDEGTVGFFATEDKREKLAKITSDIYRLSNQHKGD